MPDDATQPVTPQNPPKGALGIIFLIVFIDLLGFGVIIPALPFYARAFEASAFQMGLVFSLFSLFQFIGAPVLGALSDRVGRRPVLIVSQIGSAIGFVLLALVPKTIDWGWSPAVGLGLLYLSRIIDGLSGGNISTAQAYVADVTTPEKRAGGMALLGVAFGLGFTLGPAIGGIFGEKNLVIPGLIAAALAALAALLTYLRLPESRNRTQVEAEVWLHPSRFAPVLKMPVTMQLLLISFLAMAAFVMMETFIGFFVSEEHTFQWGARQTGLFFAFSGIVIVTVQGGLVRPLSRRFTEWPLAIGGPLIVSIGMLCFVRVAFAPSVALLLVGGFLNSAGRSLWQPTTSALLSKYTSPDRQGVVFGMFWGLNSLSRVIAPLVGSALYPLLENSGPFILAAILLAIASAWTVLLWHAYPAPATHVEPQGFPVSPAAQVPQPE